MGVRGPLRGHPDDTSRCPREMSLGVRYSGKSVATGFSARRLNKLVAGTPGCGPSEPWGSGGYVFTP